MHIREGKIHSSGSSARHRFWRMALAVGLLAAPILSAQAQSSIFNVVTTPNPSRVGNTFNAVSAISSTDVWAVGYKGENQPFNGAQTLTQHFDGVSWKTVASPNPNTTPGCSFPDNSLTAVHGVASNDVWAVGFNSSCTNFNPLALHWDGVKWKTVQTPRLGTANNNQLYGVFALASNNVYAVGTKAASNGGNLTLIEHWDGTRWSVMQTPNVNNTGNYLYSVFGTSNSDLWAVGATVAPNVPINTLVLHFNGTKWSIFSSPNPGTSSSDFNLLLSVTATSPTDATAVGYWLDASSQADFTLIEHWDGVKWSIVPSANMSGSNNTVNKLLGVSALSANNIYAVGFFIGPSSGNEEVSMIEHWDGTSWSLVTTPVTGAAQNLNGVFAQPGTQNVWVSGAFSNVGDDPETGNLITPQTYLLFTSAAN